MKAGKGDVGASLDRPDQSVRFYLFHGADDAASRALADRLLKGLGAEKFVIATGSARGDPASIADEAGAISLFGDRRALWIEPAGEDIVAAVEIVLDATAIESPVIAIAGALRKTSALLKLAEAHRSAIAFVSYPLEGRDAQRIVLDLARGEGLKLRDDVAVRVATASANNQAVIARELEKYALYLGATATTPRDLEHDTIDRLGADSGESDWVRLGDLALDGRADQVSELLQRLPPGGAETVPIVRALQRRILQIAPLRSRIEAGERVDGVLTSLGKALFWKDKPLMQRLLSQWSAPRLEQLGVRVAALERRLMLSPVPGGAALGEELLAIARAAKR